MTRSASANLWCGKAGSGTDRAVESVGANLLSRSVGSGRLILWPPNSNVSGAHSATRAIYAGSYGWGSAGSFHFPQGQLHRFLNLFGGFVRSINTYSHAAADVAMPYIAGNFFRLLVEQASWQTIARHSELVVAFGGMPLKNAQVAYGGVARHRTREGLEACRQAGVEFLNIGPGEKRHCRLSAG